MMPVFLHIDRLRLKVRIDTRILSDMTASIGVFFIGIWSVRRGGGHFLTHIAREKEISKTLVVGAKSFLPAADFHDHKFFLTWILLPLYIKLLDEINQTLEKK